MNFETVIKALVEFSFSFTNSWMLAYFAWKLYICGKKLKKRRILWWTWISPPWPAYPGDEIAVSIKLLLRWYWDQGSPPDLPMIPGCCCDLNPGTDIVEKYPHRYEQDTQIWRRYTNINADMSQLYQIHIGGPTSQQGNWGHTKPSSWLQSTAILRERALCWAFLYSIILILWLEWLPLSFMPCPLLIYYLPLCVLSLSIPVIFLIFAVLKRNKSNNIGAATCERM